MGAAQAEQEAQEADLPGGSPRWAPSRIRALVGVSGVYNIAGLADHFHERGLYRPLLDRIMSQHGRPELKLFSPAHCVKARAWPPCANTDAAGSAWLCK